MPRGGGAGSAAVLAVARQRLRRRRAATVLLLALTAVGAAAPMAALSAARRTATAPQRFLAQANTPDVTLFICPPAHDPVEDGPCYQDAPSREDIEMVRSLPGVTAAATFGFRPVTVTGAGTGALPGGLGVSVLGAGAEAPTVAGDPIVLRGRLPSADSPDEVMLTEPAARSIGLDVGDRPVLGSTPELPGPPGSGPVEVEVVAIVRTPVDLLPLRLESAGGPAFHARAGWVEAHGEDLPGFTATTVWLDDGDVDAFLDRVRRRFEDRQLLSEDALPAGELETIEHATSLESRAGLAIGATAALAAAFFIGQTVSRQSRAEAADRTTLWALGMTRRQLVGAALVRWSPVAAGGALLGGVLAWAAAALGPIGIARRAPWDRAPAADWPVLAAGTAASAGLILAAAVLVAVRPAQGAGSADAPQTVSVGPPGLRTGVALAWASLRRGAALPLASAVAATAVAVAAIVTASGAAASLRLVIDEPRRFGAPWDAHLSGGGGFASPEEAISFVSRLPGVVSAAGIVGTDVQIGDDPQVWTQAHLPIADLPTTGPVIVSGRNPADAGEIALGAITARQAGAGLGDEVQATVQGVDPPMTFRVVGIAMVTDGFEPNVGDGAIVMPAAVDRLDPSARDFIEVAIEVADGPDGDRALARLREAAPGAIIPFPVPSSLANAERIADLPVLLAVGGALLAAVTFVHALVTSVRRSRRELSVCRVIGFTRGQVHTAVATQATLLAVAAMAVGLPLGVVGARWGWRILARSFGVHSGPIVPAWVVLASAAAVIVVANLAAGPPSRSTTRRQPAEALRTE